MFGTFGRKTLALMLICIGDGMRDSLMYCRTRPLHSLGEGFISVYRLEEDGAF